jgi:hypothetical protein
MHVHDILLHRTCIGETKKQKQRKKKKTRLLFLAALVFLVFVVFLVMGSTMAYHIAAIAETATATIARIWLCTSMGTRMLLEILSPKEVFGTSGTFEFLDTFVDSNMALQVILLCKATIA